MAKQGKISKDNSVMDLAVEKLRLNIGTVREGSGIKNKRSFEFKMCKKVAELTQVVHMLFTRNHEKEVEIEAIKDAYEYEISLVIKDAKERINKLDRELAEIKQQMRQETSRLRDEIRERVKSLESKYESKLHEKDATISELENENEDLKQKLLKAKESISRLENGMSDESQNLLKQIKEKDKEINRLEAIISNREKKHCDKEDTIHGLKKKLSNLEAKFMNEISELNRSLVESNEIRENLSQKNKQLEDDVKMLKKELRKRIKSSGNDRSSVVRTQSAWDPSDEIERLRREIKWYRMELTNREGNFNRVFAENAPVRIDPRTVGSFGHFTREKTVMSGDPVSSDSISMSIGVTGREHITTSSPGRLPVLGVDHRRPTNVNVLSYSSTSGSNPRMLSRENKSRKVVPNP
ncbi:uncharacterized protein LOC102808448 [Saccoglossus kowalevskii]|uniref:Centromere protein F-like n=1 Tax=Saccoglossus kowalevskii TaxID=10224 RepID=A0ABM0M5B1_SACKO|nr:PREDICTED: centromere protein F-like [Saccoglossus kowalevskii]